MRRNVHPLVTLALSLFLLSVSQLPRSGATRFELGVGAFVGVLSLVLIPEIFFSWRAHWSRKYLEAPPWVFQLAVAAGVIRLVLVGLDNILRLGAKSLEWPFVFGFIAPFEYPTVRLVAEARGLNQLKDPVERRSSAQQLAADLIFCGGIAIALSWAFLGHTDQGIADGLVGVLVALFGLIALVEGAASLLVRNPIALARPLADWARVLGATLTAAVAAITLFLLVSSTAFGLPFQIPATGALVGIVYSVARLLHRAWGPKRDGRAPG